MKRPDPFQTNAYADLLDESFGLITGLVLGAGAVWAASHAKGDDQRIEHLTKAHKELLKSHDSDSADHAIKTSKMYAALPEPRRMELYDNMRKKKK